MCRMPYYPLCPLLPIFNDIFLATDSGDCVILVLLDLTAAFDTVDHEILISCLERWVGIKGIALKWFRSYLEGRTFCVSCGDSMSYPIGSHRAQFYALFSFLFICSHLDPYFGNMVCLSTVDSQIYVLLKKNETVGPLLKCINDIKACMALNLLSFNESKTEVMFFGGTTGTLCANLGSLSQYIK